MIGPVSSTPPTPAARSDDQKLRDSVKALEGLFVQQLYKSMRETVPQQEGIVSGGAGEDIFTSLMDEHLAAETPKQWERGLAEALYRQLRGSPMTDASQHAASPASKTL
jgi:flagellar protein FlgJ